MSTDIDTSTQSLLWSETDDRRLKDPGGRPLDAITAGELDEHLVAIADASTRAGSYSTLSVPRRRSPSCAWATR